MAGGIHLKLELHKDSNQTRIARLMAAVGVALLSMAVISSCGSKNESNSNNKNSNSTVTPAPTSPANGSTVFMEDVLPGNSLLNGSLAQNSFKLMMENLSGKVTFTIVEEKAYDYMVSPSSQGQVPTLSRQEGRAKNPVPASYQGVSGINSALGRLSITLVAPPNSYEPTRTFVFQYQMNLMGLILTSTDQVALFKATQSSPFATDFLKVNYTTKNPTIQRFRMSQLSPFPISGVIPKTQTSFWGTQWINVVSQRITTVFQKP